jgi:CMP-N,N'-diacetyllegionaminic acid synthase
VSTIAVIPARAGSQRLPRKNTISVAGKPLVAYTIEMALAASSIDAVLVSTDDEAVATIAAKLGATIIERPAELAVPESPIDDALRHALVAYSASARVSVDIVVSLQANTPVRRAGEIDDVVRFLRDAPSATAVATAVRVTERLHWAKVLTDPATMEVRPLVGVSEFRVQDLPPLYLLDGNIIAVRTGALERAAGNRRVHAYLGDRVLVFEHDSRYATEVDERHDLEVAESILKQTSLRPSAV